MATLSRSLAKILVLKIALLYCLWLAFFDTPTARTAPDPAQISQILIGAPPSETLRRSVDDR